MSASRPGNTTEYTRGDVEIGYLHREYEAYLARQSAGEASPEDEMVGAYFDYHVTRLINLYVLSRASSLDDLESLLQMIVRLAFKIMVARGLDEIKACDQIRADTYLEHIAVADMTGAHFELGREGQSESGRNMVLGSSTSEEIARLELTVEISLRQLTALRSNPNVLRCILGALEDAVPLNLDYTLGFRVRSEDCSFRLAVADRSPMLGITTALSTG
jgi:hypothetical protein